MGINNKNDLIRVLFGALIFLSSQVLKNIKNGSIRSIEHTNINYIEPHQIFIKGKLYLAFNYSTEIYIRNLGECIPIKELEKFIKEK